MIKTGKLIKGTAKQLLGEERYQTSRFIARYYQAYWQGKGTLFVHTMGKVGSSTVNQSFRAHGLQEKFAIYWTHFLSLEGIKFFEQLESEGYGGWERVPARWKSHFATCRFLYRQIRRSHRGDRRQSVVSLTRDPVATNISGFFQNHIWWPPELVEACQSRSPTYLDDLAQRFLERYPHQVPLAWFDMELNSVFEIDLFASPFPKTEGYRIYRGPKADVLVLRLEDLDRNAHQAFGEFLGVDDFVLAKANIAQDKWYSAAYRDFVTQVALPKDYIERMYTSQYAQHFYSEEEIQNFRQKWTRQ